MVYFSEEPGTKSLVLEHSKMVGNKWYQWGEYRGYEALYRFCDNVLQKPWKPAEAVLIGDPGWAFNYAAYIMKKRWIEAEPTIQKHDTWWDTYYHHFELEKYSG